MNNFKNFALNLAASKTGQFNKIVNFTPVLNELAQENAKNIMETVSRYSDYLSSTLKRISKRKGIYPDLHNALLREAACYKQEAIDEILSRNFCQHDINFIKLLMEHREYLNPLLNNTTI